VASELARPATISSESNSDCASALSTSSVPFRSILFLSDENVSEQCDREAPDYFGDLNLDQVVEAITAGREEYDLKPVFYRPLKNLEEIHDRQDAFRDLEATSLFEAVQSFADEMRKMRSCIAQSAKYYYKFQKNALFLSGVEIYCFAVERLTAELASAELNSRGFRNLCDFLNGYTECGDFRRQIAEARRLRKDLSSIRYSIHIDGKRITVGRFGGEADLSTEILRTFEKFRQGAPKAYQFKISNWPEMNHVEAAIADRVARLYPEVFSRLEEFPVRHRDFLHSAVAGFDRQVQFYLAYIEFKGRIESSGLLFCYPTVATSKDIHADDTFDLALASKLAEAHRTVVTNSFFLRDRERIFVVSGPNQGGKTTFARMFGQVHYLGLLGCPVPGSSAKLLLFDRLFTHFERQEDLENLSGKLENELKRIHLILEQATSRSILIMNESFLSTTLKDALFLSKQIMQRIFSLDMLCVTVTFLDELSTLSDSTVSMVSTAEPKDPAVRTFKIVRKPPDGLAYAAAIAQKYRLTEDGIVERISSNHGKANRS
jgi:DNA mismatch repair protein MutS